MADIAIDSNSMNVSKIKIAAVKRSGAGDVRFHLLTMLAALATKIPVCLYVLNPSAEYWDQIVSDQEATRIVRKSLHADRRESDDLHLEGGNPLLASFGRHGRDFFAALHDLDIEEDTVAGDEFPRSLLGKVQSDIFHLVERGSHGGEPKLPVAAEAEHSANQEPDAATAGETVF